MPNVCNDAQREGQWGEVSSGVRGSRPRCPRPLQAQPVTVWIFWLVRSRSPCHFFGPQGFPARRDGQNPEDKSIQLFSAAPLRESECKLFWRVGGPKFRSLFFCLAEKCLLIGPPPFPFGPPLPPILALLCSLFWAIFFEGKKKAPDLIPSPWL